MELEKVKKKWSDEASINRDKFRWLSFFTNARVLKFYQVIHSADLSKREKATRILKQLCFLVPVDYSDDVMCHMVSFIYSHQFHSLNYRRPYWIL